MKKAFSVCLALVMLAALLPSATLAQAFLRVPAANHYYLIQSATDLCNFGKQLHLGNADYSTAYVLLEDDVNMSGCTWVTGPFEGIFDGDGHTISNLTSTVGGLISELGFGGCIKDLTISDSAISDRNAAQRNYIGAFADHCMGVLMNCSLAETWVSGNCIAAGGLAGLQTLYGDSACGYQINEVDSDGLEQQTYFIDDATTLTTGGILSCAVDENCRVSNSYTSISENSNDLQVGVAGGIVGMTDSGIIDDCLNEATVTGLRPGGIVGLSQAGTLIRCCENRGTVSLPESVVSTRIEAPTAQNQRPNTLAQQAEEDCVDLWVTASAYQLAAGGILGVALRGGTNIQNCMNYGTVSGLFNIGGIVGYLLDPGTMIVNCGNDFKNGDQDYESALQGIYNVGGLVGYLIAGACDDPSDHQYAYTATVFSQAAMLINNYNAMPLHAAGVFRYDYTDGVFGGLVGRIDGEASHPSLENCHNATIPTLDEISSGAVTIAGSLVGVIDQCQAHIIHCIGAINDREAFNYTLNLRHPMQDEYADFRLIGADLSGIQLAPGFYFDNRKYTRSQPVLDDYVSPQRETLVCGGILIEDQIAAPSDYTLETGVLSGTHQVLAELNAYVRQLRFASANYSGRYFELHAAHLPWRCADQTHTDGGIDDCAEYAALQSGLAGFSPITTNDPDPMAVWQTPEDPDASQVDPNEPAVTVSHSLSLEGDICVNYYVSLPSPDPACFMEFTFGNTTLTVPIDLNRYFVKDGETLYCFSCPLNASQTSVRIDATIWVPDDGTISQDAAWGPVFRDGSCGKTLEPYSVNRYLEDISQNAAYQNNQPLMQLMRAISVYGYYANALFGTDPDFAPSVLFDASAIDGIDAAALAGYAADTQDFGTQVAYYGSSLVLRTTTAIRHYFTLAPGEDIEDYTVVCSNTGETLVPEENGSYYCVEIPNIASGNLGTNYIVQVYAPGSASPVSVWTYAGLSYAYKVLTQYENGGNISDELANVARALYVYYTCADAYFVS
ncbi:MAG: hypothetical protein IJK64_07310 [Clostridia bacterium]|nr:hypothetical protein [Clostridia bacterium]